MLFITQAHTCLLCLCESVEREMKLRKFISSINNVGLVGGGRVGREGLYHLFSLQYVIWYNPLKAWLKKDKVVSMGEASFNIPKLRKWKRYELIRARFKICSKYILFVYFILYKKIWQAKHWETKTSIHYTRKRKLPVGTGKTPWTLRSLMVTFFRLTGPQRIN